MGEEEQFDPDSILHSIKKGLGVIYYDHAFDADIIMHINTVFSMLNQMGVGPTKPFRIEDESETWDMFSTDDEIAMVKSYMVLKIRLLFDPPDGATMFQAMNDQIDEYEWRLTVAADELMDGGDDDGDIRSGSRPRGRVVSLRDSRYEVGSPKGPRFSR